MRAELERIEQIETYLMDKLSQSDKAEFEMELSNDAVLKSQVDFQANLMEGLQRMGLMHDAKNAYKIYRKRLWYKYFGIGLGVVGISFLTIVLWANNSVNYCDCSEKRMDYTEGEVANQNDGTCLDTCFQTPIKITDHSTVHYRYKKEKTPFLQANIEFETELLQTFSKKVEINDGEKKNNTDQILRSAFEVISPENNEVEGDEPIEVSNDLFDDHRFYYRLEEIVDTPVAEKKRLRRSLSIDYFGRKRRSNSRKNLGTILSSNNNEAYFNSAKKKQKRLILDDKLTEYIVNTELKMDSTSMKPYFVYDTIPSRMNIPSLRSKGKNSSRNWVVWDIQAVEIDSTYIDIVFNVSQRENSYIYSMTEESKFNMPTQFLFRNVTGEYHLVGAVREFGMEIFDKEKNYPSEGTVCHSVGNNIQFRQRVEMKSDSASILINYAYMVCANGVFTQYPIEDSILLSFGWAGGSGKRAYVSMNDDLGDITTSKIRCPNTFTPNGDGINEHFSIDHQNIKAFSIIIYERGDIVFKSNDPNFEWDGRNEQGLLLADGAYNYRVDAMGKDEKSYEIDGEIFVIRQRKEENKIPVSPDDTDVEPLFLGGETAIFKWLSEEMDLSQLGGDGTVSGTIVVDYTVSETGKVIDVVIREGLTPELDEHVLNVFKRMPDWSPGMVDGEYVSVYFSLPVVINNF